MTTLPDYRASIGQAFLASIVKFSDDAIVSKDLNGIVGTWNKGAECIFGYTAGEMIGRPITTIIPEHLHEEEGRILERVRRGERIDHYETVRRHKDGRLINISLTISPMKNAEGIIVGASKIGRDISDRARKDALLRRQTERLEALNRVVQTIASDLDLEGIVQRVTDVASELTRAKFGAFFYNVTHRGRDAYQLYTLSGAPREAFDKFGMPRSTAVFEPTFCGTGVVRSDDITADPRYGKNAPHHGMPSGHLPVVSYLAVPVVSRSGEVIGGLFFGHDKPSVFTQDAEDLAVGIASHAAVAIENARLYATAQEEMRSKELLVKEFKHRIKNILGMVQAVAGQTLRNAPKEERQAFAARLQTLAQAHDMLATRDWDRVLVEDLVRRTLAPFATERIVHSGSEAHLDANKALHLTMALHELATNAVKYGALSNEQGRIQVSWSIAGDALLVDWREMDGPAVRPPGQRGFGSVLIEEVGEGQLEFAAEGVRCKLPILLNG